VGKTSGRQEYGAMSNYYWWLGGSLAILAVVVLLLWWSMRATVRRVRLTDARRNFHLQRERLEIKFIQLAQAATKPGAPRWSDCEFENDVAYVRNRSTGELAAFVAVTIALEDADDLALSSAIENLRSGTAVFRFDRDRWETDGVALLNLTPTEAIRFYRDNLEIVAQEVGK
jgi:hypothetical protein